MISFRFHVVSITAVFLAIAIGVVVGSTYVDGAVVDGLRNRISTVSSNLDERQRESEALRRELGDAEDYVAASADFAVTGRLTEVPVLLVAVRGVDDEAATEAVRLARRAGAVTPGVLWLEPTWAAEGDRDALAEIVGRGRGASAEVLWRAAWAEVVAELQAPEPTTGTVDLPVVDEPPAPVLSGLAAAGFLTLDPLDDPSTSLVDLAATSPRVAVVGGTDAEESLEGLAAIVVSAALGGDLPVVVGHVYVEQDGGLDRADSAREGLPDGVLETAALVDDVDQPTGPVTLVLMLDAVADGVTGHFGLGDGADGILPTWTSP